MTCSKKCYASEKAAKWAHASHKPGQSRIRRANRHRHGAASQRLRVYWCAECKAYHTTNTDKR